MKQGWEIKTLGEVASFSQGIQVGLEQHLTEPKDGYVRFIRIVDYTQNTDDIRYVPNPGEKYFVNEDDIVMVRYGTPGLIGRGKAGVIANNLFRIKIERKDLSNDYLSLFLSQDDIQNYLSTQGSATMPALNFGQLKTVEVKFPPLPEQQHIVSILDECFAAINKAKANAEQNLKNAKELFESYLQGVFENGNWETKKLNEISENLDSKRIPITKNQRKSGDIPYYGASGIVDYVADYIFDEDLLCVSEDGANLLARTYPIAFSISGKTWVNNHAHVLKFPYIITQKFVEVYINSIRIDDYVSGMAQPKLNQAMLNKIPIPLPPLKEQQTIVRQLDALRAETQKLEAVYQKKIGDLEELKKSVLQKAFAGELMYEPLINAD
jgi:type I restriction enzyme, S subunit